jgi:hypothetical protein
MTEPQQYYNSLTHQPTYTTPTPRVAAISRLLLVIQPRHGPHRKRRLHVLHSRYLAMTVPLAPQFLLWANMPNYVGDYIPVYKSSWNIFDDTNMFCFQLQRNLPFITSNSVQFNFKLHSPCDQGNPYYIWSFCVRLTVLGRRRRRGRGRGNEFGPCMIHGSLHCLNRIIEANNIGDQSIIFKTHNKE